MLLSDHSICNSSNIAMDSKPCLSEEAMVSPRLPDGHSAAPLHQGILREEVLAMRQILGYTNHKEPTSTTHNLGGCLPGSEAEDILLVAIDVDVPQFYDKKQIGRQLLHIGISILDTRQLQGLPNSGQPTFPPDNVIETRQFAIGSSRPEVAAKASKASKRFLFGESVTVSSHTEVRTRIEDLLAGRNFATIFHSTTLDLSVLQDLGIDFPTTRGAYIFDTNKVAQWPLQLSYRLSLENLCSTLGVPFAFGHTAGNDAHFTLRAFLMLAVKDAHRLQQIHGQGCTISEDLLSRMQQIALAPILGLVPDQSDPMSRKAKKQQEADEQLDKKLKKKAMKEVSKQLRREARTDKFSSNDANDNSAADKEAIRSTLFAEKYQELVRFQQLPQAAKKQVRRQQQEERMAQHAEWATRHKNDAGGPSVSDLNVRGSPSEDHPPESFRDQDF